MNSNDAEIAAGEWLARLDRRDPSPEDLIAFERWKGLDPRHAAAYARLAATWQALDRVQAIRPSVEQPIDNDYLSGADPTPRSMSVQRHVSQRPWLFFSVAAALLVSIAGLWMAHPSGGPKTYRTSIGGFQRVVLEDQSAIEINTDSEVRVALTARVRKIELVRGEASFEVAHDASRPFIVFAGDTAVRAVGTKFDVHRLENSVEVTVDEGKVAIGSPSLLEASEDPLPISTSQLSAGQTATASGSGVKLKNLPKNDLARKLAWQNQMLVFDGDSLAEAAAQFNRYNLRQLVIADPSLATLHIGGYFRPTNLDAFISVLQSDFGVRVNVDGDRLILAAATAN
jgi:transmembrane sensor